MRACSFSNFALGHGPISVTNKLPTKFEDDDEDENEALWIRQPVNRERRTAN
jgi:hypothetical protein